MQEYEIIHSGNSISIHVLTYFTCFQVPNRGKRHTVQYHMNDLLETDNNSVIRFHHTNFPNNSAI